MSLFDNIVSNNSKYDIPKYNGPFLYVYADLYTFKLLFVILRCRYRNALFVK